MEKYKEVLKRLGVRPNLIGKVVNLIGERPKRSRFVLGWDFPDPKDDPFCLCAESRQGRLIVTLNLKDFPQHRLKARLFHRAVIGAEAHLLEALTEELPWLSVRNGGKFDVSSGGEVYDAQARSRNRETRFD